MTEVSDIISAVSVPSARAATVSVADTHGGAQVTASAPSVPVASVQYVNNPLARVVVTQYLNSDEQIVAQAPPRAVVAYLQDGLTANGFQPEGALSKGKTV